MSSEPIHRILVLGAGYAGLRAALDLAQGCHRHGLEREIVLADRGAEHQIITQIHQVAAGALDPEAARRPIRGLLPPEGVTVVRGEVTALEPEARRVHLGDEVLSYDRLVVALGSETALPEIPGLGEHTFNLRWWQDAVRLRQHVRKAFQRAATVRGREREGLLRITVAGGGATGCQLAGELAHWLPDLADEFGLPVSDVHLLLVESKEALLTQGGEKDSRSAGQILSRKGVDVHLRTSLEAVTADSVTCRVEGEEDCTLPCATVVWTGGVEAPPVLAASGLATGAGGRLVVDPCLRTESHPEIYAAGDAALALHRGAPLPATASFALRQGAYVATAILDEMIGRPTKPYKPRDLGMLISLGGDDAVGNVLGVHLEGSPAGLVKDNIERWYLTTVTRRLPILDM